MPQLNSFIDQTKVIRYNNFELNKQGEKEKREKKPQQTTNQWKVKNETNRK